MILSVDLMRSRMPGLGTVTLSKTAELLSPESVSPDSLLTGDGGSAWMIPFGNQHAEVFYPGPGHTEDNIVVHFPEGRILYGGCLIRPGESDNLGNTADANTSEWAVSVKRIEDKYREQLDVVIPTHGPPHGPELLNHTITLVDSVLDGQVN